MLLMLVLGLVALSIRTVKADEAVSTANVNNALPVASSASIADTDGTTTLTEGTTKDVVVTATVTDANGCEDIASVSVKLFRTDQTSSCVDDANNCYTQAAVLDTDACTAGGSDLSSTWTATIPVQYYADPTDVGTNAGTDWTAEVTPTDSIGAGTADSDTTEIATLTALDVTTPIAFGTMALGGTTAATTAYDTTVTNTGNNASIGVEVKSGAATAMTCDTGTIPVGNEKYDADSTTAYASKTALSAGDAIVAGVSAAKTTDGSSGNTDTVGWGLLMPSSGIVGNCSGTVVFTAITPV